MNARNLGGQGAFRHRLSSACAALSDDEGERHSSSVCRSQQPPSPPRAETVHPQHESPVHVLEQLEQAQPEQTRGWVEEWHMPLQTDEESPSPTQRAAAGDILHLLEDPAIELDDDEAGNTHVPPVDMEYFGVSICTPELLQAVTTQF